jgi:alkylation response protein AidB-like acyl-CoA dehydrogenase
LRGALGSAKPDEAPSIDTNWRTGWRSIADLGVTAFCVPEEQGGFGLRADVAVAAAGELGAALHGSPFAGLTASAHALAGVADDPEAAGLLAGVLSGERICAFGMLAASGDAARTVDGAADADALVLIDASAEGVLVLTDPSQWSADTSRHGFDVSRTCADVVVQRGAGHRLPSGVSVAADLYRLLLSADAVGGLQLMIDRTVAFTRQRSAFGRPIGGFQAVQHRLVDHTLRARGMALLVDEAGRLLRDGSPDARRCVAMAQVSVSSRASHILHDLLQLTGAIGFTWEYGLHFYERRVHQDARLAANPRAAARSLAAIEGWADAR